MAATEDISWATQQYNLGVEYYNRHTDERAENLEKAMVAFENVLEKLTRNGFAEDWANAQEWLGNVYRNRILGERAANLEAAIGCYKNALEVYTRGSFPEKWAMTQISLGISYRHRILGERVDNLENSILAFKNALEIFTRESFPEKWAMTQMHSGITYRSRIRGERADNLENSILAFKNALEIFTCESFPEKWAMTLNNLGVAYQYRIRGERSNNLKQAIDAFNQALQIRTRELLPEQWARTNRNLANVYCDSLYEGQLDKLDLAIEMYRKVSEVFTRSTYPYYWANNQSYLAEALTKRASLVTDQFQKNTDLGNAIQLLKAAIEISSPGGPDYIDSYYRLGNAFFSRYSLTKSSIELEKALQAYKNALIVIDSEHYDWDKIWQALPTTQAVLGSRLVRDGQWQDGLELLLNSVSQLRNSYNRLAHASALYETAYAYEAMSDWDNARLYYRDALRIYDYLKEPSGKAKSLTGLGTTLGAQGYLEKSMAIFQQARDLYEQLQQPEKVTEVNKLYDIAKRTLNDEDIEVFA
ncbi:MAG: tetratricopeptide repeat protein [Cyanobacteria bacterium P01_C01_bin.118]